MKIEEVLKEILSLINPKKSIGKFGIDRMLGWAAYECFIKKIDTKASRILRTICISLEKGEFLDFNKDYDETP